MSLPSFSLPVLTPNGGDATRQNNPDGPEGILSRIKSVEFQAAVDKKYDVPVNPYVQESFCTPHTMQSLLNTPFTPILVLALRFFLGAVIANGRRLS